MKHILKTLTFFALYLLATSFKGNDEQLTIQLYKENPDQSWTEIKSVRLDEKNNPVLHLEYDSYYTIKISGVGNVNSLNDMKIVIEDQKNEKSFSSDFKSIIDNKRKGFENYYTELPYGFASLTKGKTDNHLIYTLLVKTKLNSEV